MCGFVEFFFSPEVTIVHFDLLDGSEDNCRSLQNCGHLIPLQPALDTRSIAPGKAIGPP